MLSGHAPLAFGDSCLRNTGGCLVASSGVNLIKSISPRLGCHIPRFNGAKPRGAFGEMPLAALDQDLPFALHYSR